MWATVVYNDMYSFDPAFNIWSKLSPTPADPLGKAFPAARYGHGFAAAADNIIYLFGGVGSDGKHFTLVEFQVFTEVYICTCYY